MSGICLKCLVWMSEDDTVRHTRKNLVRQLTKWADQSCDPDAIEIDGFYHLNSLEEDEPLLFGALKKDRKRVIKAAKEMAVNGPKLAWEEIGEQLSQNFKRPTDKRKDPLCVSFLDMKRAIKTVSANDKRRSSEQLLGTYRIRHALESLENQVNCESNSAVIQECDICYKEYPDADILKEVEEHPENWVICTLYFRED